MFITKQELGFYFSIQGEARCEMLLEAFTPREIRWYFYPSGAMIFRCLNPMKYQYPIYDSYDEVIEYVIGWNSMSTSSTAQGGGGSFKNRKPIGEVGCCESGMAERIHWWTERCLISLTLSLSFSAYLPTYLSIFYVSIQLSIYLSISLSLSFIYLSLSLSISPSIYLSLHVSIYASIDVSIYLSLHLSIYCSCSCCCCCCSCCRRS